MIILYMCAERSVIYQWPWRIDLADTGHSKQVGRAVQVLILL